MSLLTRVFEYMPRLYKTMFGTCVIRVASLPGDRRARVLQVGGVYQSATYLDIHRFEPVFSYFYGFDHALDCGFEPSRVLMIGGGGYSWPKHAVDRLTCIKKLDVVEIDPVITKLARRYFYLDECMGRHPGVIGLVEADGREYLDSASAASYDCVVVDAFSGREPVLRLASVEAARAISRVLMPGGALVSNVVSSNGGQDVSFLFRYVASLSEVFKHVFIIPVEDDELAVEDNYIVYATNADRTPDGVMPYDASMLLSPFYDA